MDILTIGIMFFAIISIIMTIISITIRKKFSRRKIRKEIKEIKETINDSIGAEISSAKDILDSSFKDITFDKNSPEDLMDDLNLMSSELKQIGKSVSNKMPEIKEDIFKSKCKYCGETLLPMSKHCSKCGKEQ